MNSLLSAPVSSDILHDQPRTQIAVPLGRFWARNNGCVVVVYVSGVMDHRMGMLGGCSFSSRREYLIARCFSRSVNKLCRVG